MSTHMGGIVSCLVSQSICCIGSNAISCCCKCINASSISTRIGYALLFLTTCILSLAALNQNVESKINTFLQINCLECVGVLSVYRICAASCLLHFLLSFVMVGVESSQDPRSKLQNGFWGLKLVVYVLILGGSMYIPNEVFIWMGKYLDIPGAFLFVLVQVLFILNLWLYY